MTVENTYVKLNVEGYGGMLCAPWMDRPLSFPAGHCKRKWTLHLQAGESGPGSGTDPNLAIHMNRDVNKGYAYNPQKDMLPLYGDITAKGTFFKKIAEAAGVSEEDILGHDLFLYNRQPGSIWALLKNLSPADAWMICNVPFLLSPDFYRVQKKNGLPCTASLTTKKWAAVPNRAQLPPSCLTP